MSSDSLTWPLHQSAERIYLRLGFISVHLPRSYFVHLVHPSIPSHLIPSPHTQRSSTATGHWPGPLQKQRSHKNYADVPDVSMTYFEALQRPADLVAVLPHWPIACICIHDLPSAHTNQQHRFHWTLQVFS